MAGALLRHVVSLGTHCELLGAELARNVAGCGINCAGLHAVPGADQPDHIQAHAQLQLHRPNGQQGMRPALRELEQEGSAQHIARPFKRPPWAGLNGRDQGANVVRAPICDGGYFRRRYHATAPAATNHQLIPPPDAACSALPDPARLIVQSPLEADQFEPV